MAFLDSGQPPLPPGLRETSAAQSGPGPAQQQGPPGPPPGPFLQMLRQGQQQDPTSPGLGTQADSLQRMHVLLQGLQSLVPGLSGEPLMAVNDAIKRLSRVTTKAGGPSQGGLQTFMRDLMQQVARSGLLMQLAANQQGGGRGNQAAPGQAPAGQQMAQGPSPMSAFPGV